VESEIPGQIAGFGGIRSSDVVVEENVKFRELHAWSGKEEVFMG
jgi:hypothetical protein